MKVQAFVMFLGLFYCFMSTVIAQETQPIFEFSQTNFSIGSTYGLHPNYTSVVNASYFHGEFDSKFKVASIPLVLIVRVSDEKYRSGRPSYFKLSYDANAQHKYKLKELNDSIDVLNDKISHKQQAIYDLEGKLSYLKLKDFENADLSHLPDLTTNLNIDSLSGIPEFQGVNTEAKIDASIPVFPVNNVNSKFLEEQLSLATKELGLLSEEKVELEKLKNQLVFKKDLSFLDGIKKVDVGLTGLSQGSFSKNTIPVQGFRAAGVVRNYFYDVAAGLSVPNQLFSTSAFNQLVDNNANVFNVGNFFNVQTTRFVSSGILGLGEKDVKAISLENYYSGRSLEQIKQHNSGSTSLTSNLNGCYTFEKYPFVTVNGTMGYSTYFNDSLVRTEKEKIAYGGGLKAEFRKISSQLRMNYRSIGGSYDGFTQGIYLNGSDHYDVSLKKEFGRTLTATLRYAFDQFKLSDSLQPISKTKLGGIDLNWKLGSYTSVYGTYSIVEGTTINNVSNLSHLGKTGIYSLKRIKYTEWINTLDAGYARVAGIDSNQILTQGSLKSELRFKKWYFSAKGTYQKFVGLTRIYGESWIFEPEIGVKLKDLRTGVSWQFLKSEQFTNTNGFQFYFYYDPSPYFTWAFTVTKWLPTEYIFFLPEMTSHQNPYFLKVKLSIHLNVNK